MTFPNDFFVPNIYIYFFKHPSSYLPTVEGKACYAYDISGNHIRLTK